MKKFEPADYEMHVVRPLRGLSQLPDDLITRYDIDLGMSDAEVAERVRQVRAYWAKKARFDTNVGMVCKAFIRAHTGLEATHGDQLDTIRWWQQWQARRAAARRPEIGQLAATLRAAFGEIAMITPDQLSAEAAAYPDLTGAEIERATRTAGLTVIAAEQLPPLPHRSGLPPGSYATLRQRISDAGLRSVPALLIDNLQSFRIIDRFATTPPQPGKLSMELVLAARERINRAADSPANRAGKEAIGLLETAVAAGADLRMLTLFHLLEPVRAGRAQPSGLVRQLVAAKLDRDEAGKIVLSLLADSSIAAEDPLDTVQQLLADGKLIAAQKASAALTGEGATVARKLVREQTERVAQLRTLAGNDLAAGREEHAALRLRQAVGLASDLPELAAELARLPLPPVLDVLAQAEGSGVRLSWRPPPSHGKATRYRVVRRLGRAPATPTDGRVIATTPALALDDPAPPVDRTVHYAVFAGHSADVWSRRAVAKIRVVPPVSDVQATGERDAIILHWQAHPDVMAVRAWRRIGFGGQAPGKPLRVTNNSVRDTEVTDGVEYVYTIVAVYRSADRDHEIIATAVQVRAATRPDLTAVTRLLVESASTETGLRVQAAWRQPVGAEVVLRRGTEPPPWPVGARVSAAEIASYGQELSGAPVPRDGWMTLVAAAPPGPVVLVPFTVDRHGGIRGQEVVFGLAEPVRQLRAARFGAELLLSWIWPGEVTIAEVGWPDGSRRITRRQYRDEGGCRLALGPQAAEVEVRTGLRVDNQWFRSIPVTIRIGQEQPRLSYTLERRGSRLTGGMRCILRFASSQWVRCTVLVVVAEGHNMPPSATTGQVLISSDEIISPDAQRVLEIPLPRLRRPYWVRCFVSADDDVLLVDPPLSQLKVP